MQYLNIRKVHRLMMALALFAGGSQTALAVGTQSGTTISNTATVDYQVGANARSATGSAPDIAVDNRVDVTVANQDLGNVNVSPGQTDRIQTYLVTNTGNTTQGYILTTAVPTAGIPMNNIRIYVDADTDGVPDAGELYTAGTNAGDLDPNGGVGADVMQVLVVADVPAGATNGAFDEFRLIAQTTNAGTNTVTTASVAPDPDPTVVDVVFADGTGTASEIANDGQHSDAANYTVTSASLALAKTVLSTADEFGTDFAIPGASIEYQLRVTNSGTGSVDNNTVVVTDAIPANTKVCVAGACGGVPSFVDGGTSSGLTAATFQYSTVAAPNECAPASFTGYSPTADADGADAAVTCIRQAPTGAMNGSGGFFDVRFFVVIE